MGKIFSVVSICVREASSASCTSSRECVRFSELVCKPSILLFTSPTSSLMPMESFVTSSATTANPFRVHRHGPLRWKHLMPAGWSGLQCRQCLHGCMDFIKAGLKFIVDFMNLCELRFHFGRAFFQITDILHGIIGYAGHTGDYICKLSGNFSDFPEFFCRESTASRIEALCSITSV